MKLKIEAKEYINKQLNKLTSMQLDTIAKLIQADIVSKAPVRSITSSSGKLFDGRAKNLSSSILWKRLNDKSRIIYIQGKKNNEIASYLVFGTKPHVIYPKRKKALAWVDYRTMSLLIRKKSKPKGIKAGKYFKWEVSKDTQERIGILVNKFLTINKGFEKFSLLKTY